MRENRTYGSEGGEAQLNEPSLPLSVPGSALESQPTVPDSALESQATSALNELLTAAVAWSCAGDSRVLLTSRIPDFGHA